MSLNDVMEFEHVIQVHADGSVSDAPSHLYAPDLWDEELSSMAGQNWEFFSHGYTGQYGYSGPIMHNSEYIGGALERDILATPGYFVAVIAHWMPEGDETENEDTVEGWAVAHIPAPESE